MAQIQEDQTLDARNLLCPMPVVKTAKAFKELEPGQVLKIVATDRGAITDLPAWAKTTGNALLDWHEEDGGFVFLIKKGGE
jgi:TusA-related sulfurtransferase